MTTGGIDESLPRPFLPVDLVHQIMRWCAYLMQDPNFNERITCLSLGIQHPHRIAFSWLGFRVSNG